VIVIDIDTSDPRFTQLTIDESRDSTPERKPHFVWNREVRSLPESVSERGLDPGEVLGGKPLDPARNSDGLAILLEDSEDHVTRRYQRMLPTTQGNLPSLPWAAVEKFRGSGHENHAGSTEDLVIAYSGDREGSHRVRLSAARTLEMASRWPAASPIKDKIVLLGGSYLGQDRHETPLGTLTGVEILANVIETETDHGGGHPAPGFATSLLLLLFESMGLIVLFHAQPFKSAVLWSVLAVPVLAATCSLIAYGSLRQTLHFLPVLFALVIFEGYEHIRRTGLPYAYDELRGTDLGAQH
jgi:CHASE2 domain-containing sensor protein